MTNEQSRKDLGIKIAAVLALLVMSTGIGMHAVYADGDDKDEDHDDNDCTSVLGLPIICSDSDDGDESVAAK